LIESIFPKGSFRAKDQLKRTKKAKLILIDVSIFLSGPCGFEEPFWPLLRLSQANRVGQVRPRNPRKFRHARSIKGEKGCYHQGLKITIQLLWLARENRPSSSGHQCGNGTGTEFNGPRRSEYSCREASFLRPFLQ
jgi:hypothetical protein